MTTEAPAPPPADPAYATAVGLVAAPLGRRALGFAFDSLLVAIVILPLALGTIPALIATAAAMRIGTTVPVLLRDGMPLRSALIWYAVGQGALSVLLLVQLLLHGLTGRTAGKRLVGLRSVNVRTWEKPGFWRVLLRAVVLWLATAIVPVLGAVPFLLSPLWDPRRRGRGWLDRIGSTWLLDVRRGLDPKDRKALRLARKAVDSPPPAAEASLPSLATAASGSFAHYLPATRSSSGVVAGAPGEPAPAWTPPPVGNTPPSGNAPPSGPDPAAVRDPDPVPAVLAVLVFDDGQRVAIDGPLVIGRNPAPTVDGAEALVVPDPSMLISKTHAEIGVDRSGAWVLDRHSANGTAVVAVDGATRLLDPGTRHALPWGSTVEVGGRRIRIDPPSGGPA